jgi:catechol 2,3-dioxygenase-like lactoylglutathione lyase family enzyme
MENVIANLLKRYETGKLARRELVQGLALLVATAGQSKAAGFEIANINHVSLQVSDLQRSSQFYQKVFGLTVANQDNNTIRLKVGKSHITLRKGAPAGVADHFAIGMDGFNEQAITQDLKQRGANPVNQGNAGLHVVDPDGYQVQIIGSDA